MHLVSNSIPSLPKFPPDALPSYMCPCTPHWVIGTWLTIVHGRHYYTTCTIRRSCFGIVHTFVMGLFVTNTFHEDATRSMLRQLMALYFRHLVLHDKFDGIGLPCPLIAEAYRLPFSEGCSRP